MNSTMEVPDNVEFRSQERNSSKYLQPNPYYFCVFCGVTGHSSHICDRHYDSRSFWIKVLEERRCKNCLRLFHHSKDCFDKSLCYFNCKRRDKHSSILCYVRDRLNENYSGYSSISNTSPKRCSRSNLSEFSHAMGDYYFDHQSFKKLGRNKTSKSWESKMNKGRTKNAASHSQSSQSDITSVSKANASTQTEELSTEFLVDKVSQSCQTDFTRITSVNVQTSVDVPSTLETDTELSVDVIKPTTPSKPHLRTEDSIKRNYDDNNCCLVKDSGIVKSPSGSLTCFLK